MRGRWLSAVLIFGLPALALAQGTTVPFGGMKHDATLPVEITSDRLDLDQAAGTAVFTGTVKVGQGTLRLAADRVEVFYDNAPDAGAKQAPHVGEEKAKPAAPAAAATPASTGRVRRMVAIGNVTLANGTEAAEAEKATYEVAAGTVEMEGDVLLTQGQNALSSERLSIDLNQGTGRLEGRVKTIFVPGSAPQAAP